MVAEVIKPRRDTAQFLASMSEGFATSIRVATAKPIQKVDPRTPADKFVEKAAVSIAEFWEGFTDV